MANSTAYAQRVATLRQMIQPIEDHAAEQSVNFDTLISVNGNRDDQLKVNIEMGGAVMRLTDPDHTTATLAQGYADLLELWSAKLQAVAADIRVRFPAPAK